MANLDLHLVLPPNIILHFGHSPCLRYVVFLPFFWNMTGYLLMSWKKSKAPAYCWSSHIMYFVQWVCASLVWKKKSNVNFFFCWEGICLTYENQSALNKVDTRWKTGRDVWCQVCQKQVQLYSKLHHTFYVHNSAELLCQKITYKPFCFSYITNAVYFWMNNDVL